MPARPAELGGCQREDLAHRVIELPDTLEAGGERDVCERQVGGLDQGAGGLCPLGTRDRERTGAQLTEQHAVKMALADREPVGEPCHALAVDDAVRDQPHRTTDEITPDIPLG